MSFLVTNIPYVWFMNCFPFICYPNYTQYDYKHVLIYLFLHLALLHILVRATDYDSIISNLPF